MANSKVVLLYVTCGSEEEAAHIARELIEARLVACATFWTSRTLYRWENGLADEAETLMLLKTSESRQAAACKKILELHSYKVPCVINLTDGTANHAYASWVTGEVSTSDNMR
jgi:periplasmic divalent cation tolerance protein